ncbi:MAG: hypothetical protein GY948_18100 [Alphaproteobacteria bacterium]|nr:hypothetical protein [Alphaproteobacteria bacterium]
MAAKPQMLVGACSLREVWLLWLWLWQALASQHQPKRTMAGGGAADGVVAGGGGIGDGGAAGGDTADGEAGGDGIIAADHRLFWFSKF